MPLMTFGSHIEEGAQHFMRCYAGTLAYSSSECTGTSILFYHTVSKEHLLLDMRFHTGK